MLVQASLPESWKNRNKMGESALPRASQPLEGLASSFRGKREIYFPLLLASQKLGMDPAGPNILQGLVSL